MYILVSFLVSSYWSSWANFSGLYLEEHLNVHKILWTSRGLFQTGEFVAVVGGNYTVTMLKVSSNKTATKLESECENADKNKGAVSRLSTGVVDQVKDSSLTTWWQSSARRRSHQHTLLHRSWEHWDLQRWTSRCYYRCCLVTSYVNNLHNW